jgi:hypothetical protein
VATEESVVHSVERDKGADVLFVARTRFEPFVIAIKFPAWGRQQHINSYKGR